MNGSLRTEKGRIVLVWGTGKDAKPRQLTEKDMAVVAAGFGLESINIEGLAVLPKIAVEFEQANNAVTAFSVAAETPAELKAVWHSALNTVQVESETETERMSIEEFTEIVRGALQPATSTDELTGSSAPDPTRVSGAQPTAATDEQLAEIVAHVLADRPLPPNSGITAYNSWSAGFAEALSVARNAVLGEPVVEGIAIREDDGPLTAGDFRNPFHYVPTPPRVSSDLNLGDLGEQSPTPFGHHRAQPGRFTGELTVRFHVETPTLILDHEAPVDLGNEHKGYHVARYDNAPIIQPTSARGLIRSLVRATTNSRFQTLPDIPGGRRGGFRLGTSAAQRLVPCQLHLNGGVWTAELFTGSNSSVTNTGAPATQYAARLPIDLKVTDGLIDRVPAHGERIEVVARQTKHLVRNFEFWQVIRARALSAAVFGPTYDLVHTNKRDGTPRHERRKTPQKTIQGIVFRTGDITARGKSDERVFFNDYTVPPKPVLQNVIDDFAELLLDYKYPLYDRDLPPGVVGGPHIATLLTPVDKFLCYCLLDAHGQVEALYPVSLPRSMHATTISAKIDKSLVPPSDFKQLSPADRMFGWANDDGAGSFRSRVLVKSVVTTGLNVEASEEQDPWMPLEVQSSPKNSPRFAGSPNTQGGAHAKEERQEIRWGHRKNTIRGHKQWITPTGKDRSPEAFSFERNVQAVYQRGFVKNHASAQDNQNRSIDEWIRSGHFDVTLSVKNLTEFELGSLVWLLAASGTKDRPGCYRIGFGKSLGFGVIRPELAGSSIATTESMVAFWKNLDDDDPAHIDVTKLATAAKSFQQAVRSAYPGLLEDFDQLRFGYEDKLVLSPPRAHEERRINDRGEVDQLWYGLNESKKDYQGGLQNLGPVAARKNIGLKYFPRTNS